MIIYLHGFSSAPHSHKASELKAQLALCDFHIPPYPCEHPDDAVSVLSDFIHDRSLDRPEPIVVMGSSLGGF